MSSIDGDHVHGCARLMDGGALAYQIHGALHAGPPLLLVRPLGGTVELWGRFRARLAERHRVISFDLRGTGSSSPDPARVSTRGIARDALALLDHLGIAQADVFGISLGGMASSWLAILAPERVARLCVASAPARGLELSRAGLGRALGLAACFLRRGDDVEAALVGRILSRGFRGSHPDEVLRIEQCVRSYPTSRTVLLHHAAAGLQHNASDALARIRAPTLALAGRDDHVLGTEPVRVLASAIPGASFEITEACGHDLTLELPIATADRVSEFLRA
jgi:3-oxoadipate enol-lactonase